MNFKEIKKKLGRYTVGIAGCGGLGSNAAIALARVGIGKLVIADFDRIEETNLNRQYYFLNQIGQFKSSALKRNIAEITEVTEVEDHLIKLDPESVKKLFGECEIIIEAFDRAEMKEMLLETIQSEYPEKPIISGIGMAGWGKNELLKTERFGNLYIVGDNSSEASDELPPLAPRVCAVANIMANIALEILLGKE